MNIIVPSVLTLSLLLALSAVQAQDSQSVIKQTESHSVFKGFFLQVWSKLRTLNPQKRHSARSTIVYTAGVRGAEATETLIQPYWKGDLTQNAAFQKQLKQFVRAQDFMDKGELEASAKAFDEFIEHNNESSLLPNAIFSLGISYAGLGQNDKAQSVMKQFISSYPNHPMNADAKEVITQLK